MKGPHFFEKRKKEMARQEKAKQKADRKAQRKAGKGKEGEGEGGDDNDEFLDVEGLPGEIEGDAESGETEASQVPGGQTGVEGSAQPAGGALRGSEGG